MFATGTINPVNVKEDDVWKIAYVNIRRANVFMRYVDGSPITKSVKQQYKAEARFLRAWYYAMLLRHYGGVPLIGDNIYEVDDDMKTSRDTYADCVEYIVNECELAARDLPNKFRGINTGRATAGSCKGLISRVRLYEASKLFNGSDFGKSAGFPKELIGHLEYNKERWKDAINACEEFFTALNQNGYYKLVEVGDNGTSDVRGAYTSAYYDRGTTETLISVRRNILNANANSILSLSLIHI